MLPELGHFALILALIAAIVQSTLPLIGAATRNGPWMQVAGPAANAQLLALAVSFAALTWAYVVSDFTVVNVVENSHSAKPMIYKISGVWGNHEGSMLLWVLILALFGAMVAWFGDQLPQSLRARVLAVQGMIGIGFLLFILLTSNPFLRVDPAPLDGRDLNPLLQDPGLAFHPPFLYLGYVGFSMAFSFAVAALLEGKVDPAWARWVRPWTLLAWTTLTIGIALGSWWAYYELGWGGWWFWDPVENASFMPWLTGTALLHSAIVVEKRDSLKAWTIFLALVTFALSLLGTFLVRSGVLTSVHAFAVDPDRGLFILVLLLIAVGGSFALYAWRAPVLRGGGAFSLVSREAALVVNNVLLSVAAACVFIGTLYPLLLETLTGDKISVGPPFFNATFIPLMVPLLLLLALGPMMAWKRGRLLDGLGKLKWAALATALAIAVSIWIYGPRPALAVLGILLAAWTGFGALAEFAHRIRLGSVPLAEAWSRAKGLPRAAWGLTIAHLGVGIAIAGMTGSAAWMEERVERVTFGQTVALAGYEVVLDRVDRIQGPNYRADAGVFLVTRPGSNALIAEIVAEKRFYPVAGMPTTEAGIHTTWVSDIYAVLGDPHLDGAGQPVGWTIRLYHHPLVPWIWIGCIVMALGGVVSLTDRRLRVGAPKRKTAQTAAAPAPAE